MKKGQAALEFMLTYGWALLLLGALIAGLAYFMPQTGTLTSDKCVFGSGLPCLGQQLTNSNLTVVLRNSLGQTIYNVTANVTVPVTQSCTVNNNTISADASIIITCLNSGYMNLQSDTKMKMIVTYKKTRTGYDQMIIGELYAKKQ